MLQGHAVTASSVFMCLVLEQRKKDKAHKEKLLGFDLTEISGCISDSASLMMFLQTQNTFSRVSRRIPLRSVMKTVILVKTLTFTRDLQLQGPFLLLGWCIVAN